MFPQSACCRPNNWNSDYDQLVLTYRLHAMSSGEAVCVSPAISNVQTNEGDFTNR